MWTRFDQFAKGVFTEGFLPLGAVLQEHEVAVEPQRADIWFQPAPGREDERARRGLFGRMAKTPCLIEAFRATPSSEEVLGCLSKRLNLHRKLRREAARQERREAGRQEPRAAARPGGPPGQPPGAAPRLEPAPRLWIVSPGRPEQAMRGLGLTPMPGWPTGFWQAAPMLHLHLIVLSELPATRETLLLRLLGRGSTYRQAVHELNALPRDAWEAELAIPLLLAFRVEIPQNFGEDEMRYTAEMQAIYDEWEKRVKHTAWKAGEEAGRKAGEEAGRQQSLRDNLRLMYQARFGTLSPEVQTAIETTEDIDILQQWVVPFTTATAEEILALVRGR